MKLTKQDKELLKSWGYSQNAISQIGYAINHSYIKYRLGKVGTKEITLDEAISILGRERYLGGVAKSVFRWYTVRTADNGISVNFDSSKFLVNRLI